MIKILNLYAGIGGNRFLWGDEHQVTAVEINEDIAGVYKSFFPKDNIVVGDAHQYLLDHYEEFDFIWSSPPCPTHSRMRNLKNNCEECEKKYPDMKLYEEIIYLKHFFKGKFVVENVISYYNPLIKPFESENHYFWCNFNVTKRKAIERNIRNSGLVEKWGFDLSQYNIPKRHKGKMLNNLVHPKLGLHIFKCAFKEKQETLL
jgi:DNA (cytosine-5)-methyltransferase 1